ncbi:glycosyl transferase family 2 [Syntrophobotulus glycolicus DSM 8271]|uniref:Glycosyl transferase family 2 n=1 Tax=Syntrophobotulus glycolicus (strain DSM 8271 / FlGlyR) TaxID=645991 RepID=F0SXP8_SYNGF|nr:glycosyltransferase [Syntrophobotulus glycolicus]ADY55881.1 glycosyl transferase family 2 [Syntrophobotulus glycolicus DSM 8271]
MNLNKQRVLLGSPIYQKPQILMAFLDSLKRLVQDTVTIDFVFVDDNIDQHSSELLQQFRDERDNVIIFEGEKESQYCCNDHTHNWTNHLLLKVAEFKNRIIDYALAEKYDYLFFIDSDLVIHPYLIEHLKSRGKMIISEIFWTQWRIGEGYYPNVWLYDKYGLAPLNYGESLSSEETVLRTNRFLNQLKMPGVYEVGGLGACTLINKEALRKGVNFKPIKNLTIWGEDRFFCIRAVVLGLDLFVDTHYPAYHIYREKDLDGVSDYVNRCQPPLIRQYKGQENKLTLSMIVKNEGQRYLKEILAKLDGIIDEAVIIDDASTDDTVELCRKMLPNIPLHLIHNPQSLFKQEVELRKRQWHETIQTNPDWILNIDADEMFEDRFYAEVRRLINQEDIDLYSFRLYDMWDQNHYREDQFWNAHNYYRPFLLRYQPDFIYNWKETPLHCGRFPVNIFILPNAVSELRVKHYGWATAADRKLKYERYKVLDPEGLYGNRHQYESILEENPNLIEWENR